MSQSTDIDTLDLQDYYKNRLSMCESDGWIELMNELDNLSEVANNIESLENEKDLWFARGQLSVLRQMLALEDLAKQAAEELNI